MLRARQSRPRVHVVALLQYTSGSTGEPRGVVLTHRHLVQNRLDAIERSGVGPDSTIVLWLPLFHDMGLCVSVLFLIVSGAASVHMPPMTFVRNPLVWLREISVHSDVYSSAPDFAFHMCVDRRLLRSVRRWTCPAGAWRSMARSQSAPKP